MKTRRLLAVLLLSACSLTRVDTPSEGATRRAADELLKADRAFAASAAGTDFVTGVTAMFAADVVMPAPGIGFADGVEAATRALRADPLNATSRASWHPVRVGVSSDATQGFTIGFFTVTRADGAVLPGKYLSYWVKADDGWRVAVWRRSRRPEGPIDTTMYEPSLPSRIVPVSTDTSLLIALRGALAQAERNFSDHAQRVGLGSAFTTFGRADAMHLGGPASRGFVVGNDSIAADVGEGAPTDRSQVRWSSDRTIVASSGDLGVSIGFIVVNGAVAPGEAPQRIPFFTIWRRDSAATPWRYIAE